MGRLDGKVALVTGAASGIGRASAMLFAREGAAVALADLNRDGGEAAAQQCARDGGRALFQRADVAVEADIKAAVGRTVTEFGRLDIMFNNAGLGGAIGPIEGTAIEDWDRTQNVLLRSVFLGMKHAVPALRKVGGGAIISTASVAGLTGGFAPHAYSAAKAGVIELTRSVAIELASSRIRVNCICPGGVNTPILGGGAGSPAEAMVAHALAKLHPIGRGGTPEDIAAMALFLASDEAEWITGSVMVVDGGLTAGTADAHARALFYSASGFVGPSFERR